MYGNSSQSRFFGRLVDIIKKLECEKEVLEDHLNELKQHLARPPPPPPEKSRKIRAEDLPPWLLVVHEIRVQFRSTPNIFLDPPRMFAGDPEDQTLRGEQVVQNLDSHLRRNSDVSFVVHKEYDQTTYRRSLELLPKKYVAGKEFLIADPPEPKVESEYITVVSKPLEAALARIVKAHPDQILNSPKCGELIPEPYLFIYHHRLLASEFAEAEGGVLREPIELLLRHVLQYYGKEYDAAEALFSSGLVSGVHLIKLFRPNEIIVTRKEQDNIGLEVATWPKDQKQLRNRVKVELWDLEESELDNTESGSVELGLDSGEQELESAESGSVVLPCKPWFFNGLFHKVSREITVTLSKSDKPCPITELEAYPLRFADPSVRAALLNRGKEFWKCRYRRYVSYDRWDAMREEHNIDTRFMIDYDSYRNMHPTADIFKFSTRDTSNTLTPEEMERDDPTDETLLQHTRL
ncbi:hypothetical protein K440DRAFT_638849 [Wilcoxina mikolae CBS 423.85]|nr:hypothetical protein K440DRAFT_638849 [Wilcoxina mikolae CBS 423.85]